MKKSLFVLGLSLAAVGTSFGYDGTFGFGIEILGTGANATNNGVTTMYALDMTDNNALLPTGSTATLSTAWPTTSTEGAPTFNLGTFTTGNTLILTGGSLLTYQGTNGVVTNPDGSTTTTSDVVNSAALNYEIATGPGSGTFPSVNLSVNATNFDNPGNTRWSTETAGVNLLAGLAPGTYEISVYGSAATTETSVNSVSGTTTTAGGLGDVNGGANWGATFTVVPEPGTVSMLLLGLGGLIWSQKRFFKKFYRRQSKA